MNFVKCTSKHGVYAKVTNANLLLVFLYVDDLLVTSSNEVEIMEFKEQMMKEFEMTDLGHYATNLLKRFNMIQCNPIVTLTKNELILEKEGNEELVDSIQFRQIVGFLKYLCNTKVDLAFGVSLISRFTERQDNLLVGSQENNVLWTMHMHKYLSTLVHIGVVTKWTTDYVFMYRKTSIS
ncbi:Copia protein, partial [Mucuna pruriens]